MKHGVEGEGEVRSDGPALIAIAERGRTKGGLDLVRTISLTISVLRNRCVHYVFPNCVSDEVPLFRNDIVTNTSHSSDPRMSDTVLLKSHSEEQRSTGLQVPREAGQMELEEVMYDKWAYPHRPHVSDF